jgi:3-hydroxyacyl-CoA dehydrogenase
MVGLDILGHVVANMAKNVKDERSDLKLPNWYQQMLERKLLGDKTKSGFYKKSKDAAGKEERFAIDWKTLEYRPRLKPKFQAAAPISILRRLAISPYPSRKACGVSLSQKRTGQK